ncbi:hypothetical protein, conserved [Leishmania tarentolae]|uniref:Uncharacterized protein n=1 Tax=Leishmania tarentolae TaxID=5689 RepID=A0A640KUZ2_LEITA|nr:hypothetical protein, conserved [Leishmania tarentolae]
MDRSITTRLDADAVPDVTHEARDGDIGSGTLPSPLELYISTKGVEGLHTSLETTLSVKAPKTVDCGQNNLHLAQSVFTPKDDATTGPCSADEEGAMNTLSRMYFAECDQGNCSVSHVTDNYGHGVLGGEEVSECSKTPGDSQQTLLHGSVPPKTIGVATNYVIWHLATPTREVSAIWHPQGMIKETDETFDARSVEDDASSMAAVVLSEEVPDDLPPAPSPFTELCSRSSTPSVKAIHLNLQYTTATSFMSISSPFSTCVQSISFLRNSVQQLMSSSQQFCASSTSAAANEPSLSREVGSAEPRPFCAPPLQTGWVVSQGSSQPASLRSGTFTPFSVEQSGSSEVFPFSSPSAMSTADNASLAQQVSLQTPGTPYESCPAVAHRASSTALTGCLLEEGRERSTLLDNQGSGFEMILAREVSAYLSVSGPPRKAAGQSSEYVVVTEQRKLLEEETNQLHDTIQAPVQVTED